MSQPMVRRRARGVLAAVCVGAMGLTLAAVPAGAAVTEVGDSTVTAVPAVNGPVPVTPDSDMWSAMERARVPFDVADFGFVEEEYFLSGTANVYDHVDGAVTVVEDAVPYVNNILVRRPAAAADSSGVVLVDILNASNGFPGEDHWRRMWQWALEEGHTVIGLTSKPIQIDALHNYNPERYADLTWDLGDVERDPILADPANPGDFNPHMVVEGAEEGLTWDITTQLGVLLAGDEAGSILGGQAPQTTLLMGQSQSAVNLNTYVANFHAAQAEANDGSVWDGYLATVGGWGGQRALRQGGAVSTAPLPTIDVPHVLISAEGDTSLFGSPAGFAETELSEGRVHWQVPGTPHTDLLSTVIPADEEIYRAGRLPNTAVHGQEFRDALNLYPIEPAIIAAAQALIDADQDGTALPASQWFDQADGELVRDEAGNVTGGVRSGLIDHPLGQYLGAASPGAVYGSMDLMTAEEFAATYGTRREYLALVAEVDAAQVEAGYLTAYGVEYFRDVANELLDRIGVPADEAPDTLTALPEVEGPIAQTEDSYLWSTMEHARVPFDVADYGFVEEEYFLSGTANVYDHVDGEVAVVEEGVPYVNNILVRRPAEAADSSGVVLVDILNASNGFPGEDHWRRMWQWAFDEGHTVIGLTSKPIQISALQNFDPERYADLTWDIDPDVERDPIVADPDDPSSFDPFMVVEGAEEGLVWDITTQLGVLLASDDAGSILGGQTPRTTLLMGQSQSGVYLNTYTSNFHEAQAAANGGSVWDGYLNSVGAVLERPLRQGDVAGLITVPGSEPGFDVPYITVTAEGDAGLFGASTLLETDLPENRFHWQVSGAPHTDLLSTVIPADEEIGKAGRTWNSQVHDPAFREALNLYPIEPAIIAAAQALIDADQHGTTPAPSRWFDQADGELVRDEAGNVTGGVRSGLIDYPLGQYLGAASPGAVYGSMELISAEEFTATYGTRAEYHALVAEADAAQVAAGYLTPYGVEYFRDVANELLDRIGVPADVDPTAPPTDEPTDEPTPGATPGGQLPVTGASVLGLAGLAVALIVGAISLLVMRRRRLTDR